jgi:tetratricopeptide (TPR) repeat protein
LPEFVQAASIMPYDARLQVDLGTAYLNTGQDDKALASFDTAVKLWDGPTIWNSIAYQLALRNSHLDRARQYAESAVSARATALRNVDMATATPHDFWRVGALASYWDTLGWVFFALKDPDTAEKYVSSSWKLRQLSSSADLLGQIYEKRGQRDRAIEAYAWALAGEHAPNSAVSRRLAALLGGEDKVAGEVAKHRDGVLAAQTTHLDARGPANADGEFVVMIASGGGTPTQDARVVDGDPRLKILEEPLRTAKFDITFPPGPPTKIFLHGTVSCSGSGECSFVRSWQVRPEPSN